MNYNKNPQNIERHSFEIISQIIADERPDYRFADELQEKSLNAQFIPALTLNGWISCISRQMFYPVLHRLCVVAARSTPTPPWRFPASIKPSLSS